MTEQDQDLLVGKAVRELRDLRETLAKLDSRAHAIGDTFATVGQQLRTNGAYLRFSGEAAEIRFTVQADSRHRYTTVPKMPDKADIDLDTVVALRDEMRTVILEIERLEKSLAEMGYNGKP